MQHLDLSLLARLGVRHCSTVIPEALYLNTGIDTTRPTEIRASVTNRCNYKCLQCGCWRMGPDEEMTVQEWISGLESIHQFLGRYCIQFVGGEPFVKKGMLQILEFCARRKIDFGLISNGSAFRNRRLVDRFLATRPMKVEISVDGPSPAIHDRLRGVEGSLNEIEAGLRNLVESRRASGGAFPIRIKSTLNAWNFRTAPEIVQWARTQGATSIDFEPIREWTDESRNELWPSAQDCDELEEVVETLLQMQSAGEPIETSEHKLRGMIGHFRREPAAPEVGTCRIGLRVFSIDSRGIVTSCDRFKPLGDLKRQSAREIWTNAVAQEQRRRTVDCTAGCTYGCMATKPFLHTIKRGLRVFTRPIADSARN